MYKYNSALDILIAAAQQEQDRHWRSYTRPELNYCSCYECGQGSYVWWLELKVDKAYGENPEERYHLCNKCGAAIENYTPCPFQGRVMDVPKGAIFKCTRSGRPWTMDQKLDKGWYRGIDKRTHEFIDVHGQCGATLTNQFKDTDTPSKENGLNFLTNDSKLSFKRE